MSCHVRFLRKAVRGKEWWVGGAVHIEWWAWLPRGMLRCAKAKAANGGGCVVSRCGVLWVGVHCFVVFEVVDSPRNSFLRKY